MVVPLRGGVGGIDLLWSSPSTTTHPRLYCTAIWSTIMSDQTTRTLKAGPRVVPTLFGAVLLIGSQRVHIDTEDMHAVVCVLLAEMAKDDLFEGARAALQTLIPGRE